MMIYRKTSTEVSVFMVDEDAKQNINNMSYNTQAFVDSSKLLYSNNRSVDYMTNELNYSILDDTLSEIPINNDFVYVSNIMSGSNRLFQNNNPTIEILFDGVAKSSGITLNFDGHYLPNEINIKYYDVNNNLISDNNFNVLSLDFFCNNKSLITYHKILITFNSTKYPFSFVKLNNIEYGCVYSYGSDNLYANANLLNAKIVEETDILSNNLVMNTCEFTIYDEREDFNVMDPNDIYNIIQRFKRVEVYEIIETYDDLILKNKHRILMGNFYIKSWRSIAEHELTFSCVDLLGILEESKFDLANKYEPDKTTVGDLIDSISKCINLYGSFFGIDAGEELRAKRLKGFLTVCSCREALQQILFCIGAVADCSRSNNMRIYIPSKSISYNISDSNNLEYEQIQNNDIVSDVNIYSCSLKDGNKNQVIFEGNLSSSSKPYLIKYDGLIKFQMGEWVTESGAKIPYVESPSITPLNAYVDGDDVGLSYINLHVFQTSDFTIIADTYSIDSTCIVHLHNNNAKSKKEITCKNNYLLNDFKYNSGASEEKYATDTANRLLEYYSKPNIVDTEIILTGYYDENNNSLAEQTGRWCILKNKYGNTILGNIRKMEIDLTGGFIAKVKLVCAEELDNSYVCSNFNNSENDMSELYSGDDIGLI